MLLSSCRQTARNIESSLRARLSRIRPLGSSNNASNILCWGASISSGEHRFVDTISLHSLQPNTVLTLTPSPLTLRSDVVLPCIHIYRFLSLSLTLPCNLSILLSTKIVVQSFFDSIIAFKVLNQGLLGTLALLSLAYLVISKLLIFCISFTILHFRPLQWLWSWESLRTAASHGPRLRSTWNSAARSTDPEIQLRTVSTDVRKP